MVPVRKARSFLYRLDWRLSLVLFIACALRLSYPGLYQLVGDEVSLLNSARLLARHGVWTWVGNYSYSSFLEWHSPLSTYFAAVPYLFSPDPRLGRIWVGLLCVAAVAIVYGTLKCYFGADAALIGGALLAAHAPAVDWSRFVFNPDFAQPFIALWMLTGVKSYQDNSRWAQPVHWLALSAAIQMHPGNALLILLSLLLVGLKLWRDGNQRWQSLRWTLIAGLLFGLSFVPWLIGLAEKNAPVIAVLRDPSESVAFIEESEDRSYTLTEIASTLAALGGSVERRLYPSGNLAQGPTVMTQRTGNWTLPDWTDKFIFYPQAVLTWLSVLALIAIGLWRRFHMPMLMLGLLAVLPVLSYLVSPGQVQAFYLVALIFGAVPGFAVVLAFVASRCGWWRRVVFVLVGIMVTAQSLITISTLRSQYLEPNLGHYAAALDTYRDIFAEWDAERKGREIIFLTEGIAERKEADFQAVYWWVTGEGYPTRVVAMKPAQGLPVPAQGALVAGIYPGQLLPQLFGEGNTAGTLSGGEPMVRWTLSGQSTPLPVQLLPQSFAAFANGVSLVGLSPQADPQPGQDWPVTLVWNIEGTDQADNYSFSVRLVDDSGNRFAQADGLSLDGALWRTGDTVYNRFSLPVSADYPGGPIRVQILMYKTDIVPLVDGGGAAVGSEVSLVPDVPVIDDLGWFEYRPAGRFAPLEKHKFFAQFEGINLLGFNVHSRQVGMGQSVPITLYWTATQAPGADYHVFVHLKDADDNLVGQSDKSNPAESPTSHWTTARYLADQHLLVLGPTTPPGDYQLFVGLWEESIGRLPAHDSSGILLGDSIPLGVTITVQP